MSSPTAPLLGINLRTWLSAKGFWLVAAAALLPLVLTGAWAGAHRADLTASGLEIPDGIREGDNVTFRATIENTGPTRVDEFNATLAVGTVSGSGAFFRLATNTTTIEAMGPGERRVIALAWTATPGYVYAVAFADEDDVVAEVDEYDNQDARPVAVAYAAPAPEEAPAPPEGLAGDENATRRVDVAVQSIRHGTLTMGETGRFEAVFENRGNETVTASVVARVGQSFQGSLFPSGQSGPTNVTLEPGATHTVTVEWAVQQGAWWHEAYVLPPEDAAEATPEDNHEVASFTVDPTIPADATPPEIPEKLTIKEFYLSVLRLLHLRVLLPFIALFYAAGVVVDEREKGSLSYILTRPVPRWLIPLTKFAASFLVASIAALVGLLLTYLLLFRATPQGSDIGFLTTPILAALLTLFVYGALFTLIGVWSPRPYLAGIAWVLGWEIVAYNFATWVRNLTVRQHLTNALAEWPIDKGFHWMPEGEAGTRALLVLLAAGVGCLIAASAMMKKREFEL